MTDQPPAYAPGLDRLGHAIELNAEVLETVRARIHDMANHIATSNMQLASISSKLDHIERATSDHEMRLRDLEGLSPKHFQQQYQKERERLETRISGVEEVVGALKGMKGLVKGVGAWITAFIAIATFIIVVIGGRT